MTDKTEAQPEALRLAEVLATSRHQDISEAGHLLSAMHAELQQLKTQITTQTNRAASAEQRVAALTQRLDMANRLNTDARDQLAQLSARQAAPDGWHAPGLGEVHNADHSKMIYCADGDGVADDALANEVLNAMLSATPPPPDREPLSDQEVLEAVSSLYAHPEARSMGAADDIATARAIERAHGIGATND